MRMARRRCRGSSRGVRSSDRPSTSRRRDTTRICSTTLRCSKIPPRRNRCGTAAGGRLRAASLVEAVVAAVVLLIAFTAAMELLPRLTLRGDDALAVAEAEYRAMCAFDKYGSGVWPAGTYVERYGGGEATVRVEPYRQYNDVQLITIEVRIDGSRKRIVHRQLVECAE